ncbi:hypothetical protein XJ32_06485 [Helicobacter bilis]|uniref:DUF177 domain-containing protein n=1 Tax=Helicobacter bilis TaxID=37372 RepID=A0A1Q2LHA2_9HELI|nr:hypothetical protein XJ32_06485 [Helicobacter bilis]
MRIEFRKITEKPKQIHLILDKKQSEVIFENEHIELQGEIMRQDSKLAVFRGNIKGNLQLICSLSGNEFSAEIDESLVLYFSDGIWEAQSQSKVINSLDVIEFFDGFIDFDFVLASEIESIRLDYNIEE